MCHAPPRGPPSSSSSRSRYSKKAGEHHLPAHRISRTAARSLGAAHPMRAQGTWSCTLCTSIPSSACNHAACSSVGQNEARAGRPGSQSKQPAQLELNAKPNHKGMGASDGSRSARACLRCPLPLQELHHRHTHCSRMLSRMFHSHQRATARVTPSSVLAQSAAESSCHPSLQVTASSLWHRCCPFSGA